MTPPADRRALVAGLGVIVIVNLSILGTAAWNRHGEPRFELSLTERELALPTARQDDGTGIELSFVLTHEPPASLRRAARRMRRELEPVDYDWLDRAKAAELGFRADGDGGYDELLPRPVFLVVEYDGPAWRHWLAGREERVAKLRDGVAAGRADPGSLTEAEALLEADRTMRSRLFPVDAGLRADVLGRRYADRPGCAVVPGIVRPKIRRSEGDSPRSDGPIVELMTSRVYVDRRARSALEPFLPTETWDDLERRERLGEETGWPAASVPRYGAVVAVGRRYEPWLVRVSR